MTTTAELTYPCAGALEIPSVRKWFAGIRSADLAVDLGSANTAIYERGRGLVLHEPSVGALDRKSGKLVAVGREAKEMHGKTSTSLSCVRPIREGVIANLDAAALMLECFLSRLHKRWRPQKPRLVVGIAAGSTQVERRATIDVAMAAGAREVTLIEEPLAAALGANLAINHAVSNMIVDIGGGTTGIAVVGSGGTVYAHSIRIAGDELDLAIQRLLKRRFGFQVGIFEAERAKIAVGSALPRKHPRSIELFGQDLSTRFPVSAEISETAMSEALDEPISAIISLITTAVERLNPETARDIVSRGAFLAGGGSLLSGIEQRLSIETGIRFNRAQDPLTCVARGIGMVVENLKEMRALCLT